MSAALDAVGKIICVGGGLLFMFWFVISLCVIAARADHRMEQMEEEEAQPVELDGYLQEYAKQGPTKMLPDRALREEVGMPVIDIRTGKYVNTSDHVHERRGK